MKFLERFESVRQALGHRNFAVFAAGCSFGFVGVWLQKVAVGWLAWELSHSSAWVGIIAFADLFPTVLVSPLAGTAADRWNRLRTIRITQSSTVILALLMVGLLVAGLMTIWVLLVMTIFLGIAYAFNQTLQLTIVPSLTPRSAISQSVALTAVIFNVARFIGPAIAGPLIVASGVAAAFVAMAVFHTVFLLALLRIKVMTPDEAPSARQGVFAELAEGLRYAAVHPGIGPVIVLLLAASLGCRPVIEVLPAFVGGVFNAGAGVLALFTSAVGVGSVIGGLWLGVRPDPKGLTGVTIFLSLLLGLSTMAFSLIHNIWVALPVMVVLGFAMTSSAIGAQTLVQLTVAGAMRGRISGLFGLIFRGGPALGALLIGYASTFFGLGPPQFVGGIIAIAVWLWAHLRRRQIAAAIE